jgi:DNA-binding MarR family transcriptional regulator
LFTLVNAQPITPALASDLALACGRLQRHAKRLAGLPPASSTWRVLHTIEMEGPLSPGTLTRLEGNRPSATTDLIARLQRDGLVSRRPDPADARSSLISVTPAGVDYCRRAEAAIGESLAPALAGLSPQHAATLADCLPAIQAAVALLREAPVTRGTK